MTTATCNCSREGACPGTCHQEESEVKIDRNIRDEHDYLGTVYDRNPVDEYWRAKEYRAQALVAGAALLGALVLIGLVVVAG